MLESQCRRILVGPLDRPGLHPALAVDGVRLGREVGRYLVLPTLEGEAAVVDAARVGHEREGGVGADVAAALGRAQQVEVAVPEGEDRAALVRGQRQLEPVAAECERHGGSGAVVAPPGWTRGRRTDCYFAMQVSAVSGVQTSRPV